MAIDTTDSPICASSSASERWQVEGIWRGPEGRERDVRQFSGSRHHVERVLTRLEGKGRLLRRLNLRPL